MIIQQFTLRDFKAHSETCLVFNGPLTLITGANNTGKTSVLEALQAFAECLAQARKRVLRANHPGVRAGWVSVGEIELKSDYLPGFAWLRGGDCSEIFRHGQRRLVIEAVIALAGEYHTLGFVVSTARGQQLHIEPVFDAGHFIPALNQTLREAGSLVHIVKTAPVSRIARREAYQHEALLNASVARGETADVLRNRLLRLKQADKLETVERQVEAVLGLRGFRLAVTFDPASDIDVTVRFSAADQPESLDIALLGSGTLQTLALLVDVNLAPPRAPLVVLVDEPDSHLHYAAQKRLLRQLRQLAGDRVQIVATTHNEQMIAAAETAELIHLDRSGSGRISAASLASASSGRRLGFVSPRARDAAYQHIGVSQSAMNIIEAMEAERVLVVEGPTDAELILAILERVGVVQPGFVVPRCAFWSLGGISRVGEKLKALKDWFSGIHNAKPLWSKCVVVLDRDHLSAAEARRIADRLCNYLAVPVMFWEAYTIESSLLWSPAPLATALAQITGGDAVVAQTTIQARVMPPGNWWDAGWPALPEFRADRVIGQRREREQDLSVGLKGTPLSDAAAVDAYRRWLLAEPNVAARVFGKNEAQATFQAAITAMLGDEHGFVDEHTLLLDLIRHWPADALPSEWLALARVLG